LKKYQKISNEVRKMTTRGGKREGSGRKKGAPNKRTIQLITKAAASGYEDPVDFLLSVVSDTGAETDLRVKAAGMVAPYVRAKLAPREAGASAPPLAEEGIALQLPDLVRVK
jgi:hypothetical protein